MKCHEGCAACCIAPQISSELPNMPNGKAAGVRCVNLDDENRCRVYEIRPAVCRNFMPATDSCGDSYKEALTLIAIMEQETS